MLTNIQFQTQNKNGYFFNSSKEQKCISLSNCLDKENDKLISCSGRITEENVKLQLANLQNLTFEVTDKCNLNCYYCSYGPLYGKYDKRETKNMDFKTAKLIIDYLVVLWKSQLNLSHDKIIRIYFSLL